MMNIKKKYTLAFIKINNEDLQHCPTFTWVVSYEYKNLWNKFKTFKVLSVNYMLFIT